jgi:hypothetical protein
MIVFSWPASVLDSTGLFQAGAVDTQLSSTVIPCRVTLMVQKIGCYIGSVHLANLSRPSDSPSLRKLMPALGRARFTPGCTVDRCEAVAGLKRRKSLDERGHVAITEQEMRRCFKASVG